MISQPTKTTSISIETVSAGHNFRTDQTAIAHHRLGVRPDHSSPHAKRDNASHPGNACGDHHHPAVHPGIGTYGHGDGWAKLPDGSARKRSPGFSRPSGSHVPADQGNHIAYVYVVGWDPFVRESGQCQTGIQRVFAGLTDHSDFRSDHNGCDHHGNTARPDQPPRDYPCLFHPAGPFRLPVSQPGPDTQCSRADRTPT